MRQTGEADLLLNAVEAAGASTVNIDIKGYDIVGVQVTAAAADATATLEFQASLTGSDWIPVQGVNANDGVIATAVATSDSGLYYVGVSGFTGFRVELTAYTDGTITVDGFRQVGGAALALYDVDLTDADITNLSDSEVNLYALDTDATFSAIQMDSAVGSLIVNLTGDTVILAGDSLANPTLATKVLSFVSGFDSGGADWDRIRAVFPESIDTAIVIGDSDETGALLTAAIGYAYNESDAGFRVLRSDSDQRLQVSETWNSTMQNSTVLAVQDKDFEVPADLDWHVLWIWIQYTSNASAGARQLRIDVEGSDTTAGEPYLSIIPGVTQAASLTYRYSFAPGNADLTAVRDSDYISTPLPSGLILPELHQLRIFDQAVITGGDTAGENMIVKLMVMDRARVDS